MQIRASLILSLVTVMFFCTKSWAQQRPNILIVITDDMGIDAFNAYNVGLEQPNTPFLDSLMSEGIMFNNAYGTPKCSPSRAALLTGKYGNKNGVMRAGPTLPDDEITIFEHLEVLTNDEYAGALFGKWHLGDAQTPNEQGIDHFVGFMGAGVSNYYDWDRTENGVTNPVSEYITTHLTNEAIDWIDTQDDPWLCWMAYAAPKGEALPPESLYTRTDTTTTLDRFLCRIEAVDHELQRLYHSLTQEEKDSTFILFVGDNGTGNNKLQAFPNGHGKNTVYEGGIRLPMFATGYGVDRVNEEEDGLVHFTDFFATITEMLGTDLPGGINNSFSFYPLLSDPNAPTRPYNYSEINENPDRAIRDDQYKLIEFANGEQEFYNLLNDPLEFDDLLVDGLTTQQQIILDELKMEMDMIYNSWSCNDGIQNGDEEGIDCGGSNCSPCVGGPVTIFAHYFETGWDGWTSGGNDCLYYTGNRSYEGISSILIRDNSGINSSMTSEVFDLSIYQSADISFHYSPRNMDDGEDFFLQMNTGSNWFTIGHYVSGTDFTNGSFWNATVSLPVLSSTTQFRFMCDASGNNDRVYLDAISLKGVIGSSNQPSGRSISNDTNNNSSLINDLSIKEKDLVLYPNPAQETLYLQTSENIKNIKLIGVNGEVLDMSLQADGKQIDVSKISPGYYVLLVETEQEILRKTFVKM